MISLSNWTPPHNYAKEVFLSLAFLSRQRVLHNSQAVQSELARPHNNTYKLSRIYSCRFCDLRETRFDGGSHSRCFKRFRVYETDSNIPLR